MCNLPARFARPGLAPNGLLVAVDQGGTVLDERMMTDRITELQRAMHEARECVDDCVVDRMKDVALQLGEWNVARNILADLNGPRWQLLVSAPPAATPEIANGDTGGG
jgi:hypothetical protein